MLAVFAGHAVYRGQEVVVKIFDDVFAQGGQLPMFIRDEEKTWHRHMAPIHGTDTWHPNMVAFAFRSSHCLHNRLDRVKPVNLNHLSLEVPVDIIVVVFPSDGVEVRSKVHDV